MLQQCQGIQTQNVQLIASLREKEMFEKTRELQIEEIQNNLVLIQDNYTKLIENYQREKEQNLKLDKKLTIIKQEAEMKIRDKDRLGANWQQESKKLNQLIVNQQSQIKDMLAQESEYQHEINNLTEVNETLNGQNEDAKFKNRQLQTVLGQKQDQISSYLSNVQK